MTSSFYATLPARGDGLLSDYTAHLLQRDGALIGRDRLEVREQQCDRLDTSGVVFDGPIDTGLFERQYRSYDKRAEVSDELQALLAFVKINAGEAYGVEVMVQGKPELFEGDGAKEKTERVLLAEEHYHTRLLVGALNHFPGLGEGEAWIPAAPIRILVHGLLRCPEAVFYPVLLASELAGIQAFTWVLNRLPSLFPDHPQVRDSLEERLSEVIVDEIGHIAYNRVLVGPGGMRFARWLAPQILRGIVMNAPELKALGLDARTRRDLQSLDLQDVPAHIRSRAWFV
ncbi:MAG: hypothetical protein KC502_07315 [Myxococcales bacterium]|nr:hypothetical protein [Myxococcales bacterium]